MGASKMAENEDDEKFESADAGASLTIPSEAGAIKKGGYLLMKGFPCKVSDIKTSKTGKHGHAKCVFTGYDIFTDKKYETMSPSTHGVEVPIVNRVQYECMDVDEEGFASLMDENSETREDLKMNDALIAQARPLLDEDGICLVDVLSSMGKDQIMSVKKAQE